VIRVGFICDTFDLGGQEQGCLEVMRRLDRERFQPYFFSFRPGTLLPEVEALGLPISIGYHKPGSDMIWTDDDECARRTYSKRLSEELRASAIDVCLIYAWRDGAKAARDAGVGAVVERVDGLCLTTRLSDKSLCERIICESKAARDVILAQRRLLNCRREQIVVIPNGVDLNRFNPETYDRALCRKALGLEPNDFVVCSIARLAGAARHRGARTFSWIPLGHPGDSSRHRRVCAYLFCRRHSIRFAGGNGYGSADRGHTSRIDNRDHRRQWVPGRCSAP
jgi:glycosyltransferase involved in cell wall biosynthesis